MSQPKAQQIEALAAIHELAAEVFPDQKASQSTETIAKIERELMLL